MQKIFLPLIILLIFFSCQSERTQQTTPAATTEDAAMPDTTVHDAAASDTVATADTIGIDTSAAVQIFDASKVPAQTFAISAAEPSVIFGQKGTLIAFPKGAFGNTSGEVTIELKEVFNLSDTTIRNFLTANGQKTSLGAVYISAKSGGKTVSPAKSYYIEIPVSNSDIKDVVVFKAAGSAAKPEWVPVRLSEPADKITKFTNIMIPLPLDKLNLEVEGLPAQLQKELKAHKYENTIIATRAFQARLQYLSGKLAGVENAEGSSVVNELVKTYLNNSDEMLFMADRKVYQKLLEKIKDSRYKDSREELRAAANTLRNLSFQKLTKPLNLYPYGIELTDKYAYNQLLSKGVSNEAANEYMLLKKVREELIQNKGKGRNGVARLFYRVSDTGWLNVGR